MCPPGGPGTRPARAPTESRALAGPARTKSAPARGSRPAPTYSGAARARAPALARARVPVRARRARPRRACPSRRRVRRGGRHGVRGLLDGSGKARRGGRVRVGASSTTGVVSGHEEAPVEAEAAGACRLSAAAINSAGEALMVSSAGSLARGSNWYEPSSQPRASMTTSSPCPLGPLAWKRCPKRKYSEQLSPPLSMVSVPVARSACIDCSSVASPPSRREPWVCTVCGSPVL